MNAQNDFLADLTVKQEAELRLLIQSYEAAGRNDRVFKLALHANGMAATNNKAAAIVEMVKLAIQAGYDKPSSVVKETTPVFKCTRCQRVSEMLISNNSFSSICFHCNDEDNMPEIVHLKRFDGFNVEPWIN